MAHTHISNLIHCVFSTKERANLIPDPAELWRYITGIAKNKDILLLAAGATANHVHLLLSLRASMPIAEAMRELKGNSSKWLNQTGVRFAWQEGYGAFSVSYSLRNAVAEYIAHQEEHHRKWTFEQEFMTLLNRSGVAYDPQYVFG